MSKSSPGKPNAAYTIGRGIQFLAFISGTVAVSWTLYVMTDASLSTAPPLGLALSSGALFTLGWFVQRHLGEAPGQPRKRRSK